MEMDSNRTFRQLVQAMEQGRGKKVSTVTLSRGLKQLGLRKLRSRAPVRSGQGSTSSGATRYRSIHRREPKPGQYPPSLTDHEWQALCPLLETHETRGRPARHSRRTMWDAVFYLVRGGGSWRMLPSDFPPYKAVYAFFAGARDSDLLEHVYERLHALWRERSGRQAQPSVGVVDSQSVKTTEKGGSAVMTPEKSEGT